MNDSAASHAGALRVAFWVFLACTALQLLAIWILNSGHLVFTLDDSYIHLALAENLLDGHYGVNRGEFSAPSSSILWPFLITPFAWLSLGIYGILAINLAAAIGIMIVLFKLLLPAEDEEIDERTAGRMLAAVLVLSIPALNLTGLVFTGMEHSVQVFLAVLMFYGLVHEVRHEVAPWWLFVAIVAAPLVRYECLALSLPAASFLFLRGHRARAVSAVGLLAALLVAFAGFLVSLGLDPFPTSIIVKSSVVSSGGEARSLATSLAGTLKSNLKSARGAMLVLLMLALLIRALDEKTKKSHGLLALAMAASISMHLLAGQYGSFGRYEIYIWAPALFAVLHLGRSWLYRLPSRIGFYKMLGAMALACGLLCYPYVGVFLTAPIASNNIFEQQYQMHRFATKYYNKPVAVNDLGYVSYRNRNYVLDLWGLASAEVLEMRTEASDGGSGGSWMAAVARQRDVGLAMIYDSWFQNRPADWHRLGVLSLGKPRITPARPSVTFYATNCGSFAELRPLVESFMATLPEGVVFELAPDGCDVDDDQV